MNRFTYLLSASLLSFSALAENVDETSMGEAVERHLSTDIEYTEWVLDSDRIRTEASDEIVERELAAVTFVVGGMMKSRSGAT